MTRRRRRHAPRRRRVIVRRESFRLNLQQRDSEVGLFEKKKKHKTVVRETGRDDGEQNAGQLNGNKRNEYRRAEILISERESGKCDRKYSISLHFTFEGTREKLIIYASTL